MAVTPGRRLSTRTRLTRSFIAWASLLVLLLGAQACALFAPERRAWPDEIWIVAGQSEEAWEGPDFERPLRDVIVENAMANQVGGVPLDFGFNLRVRLRGGDDASASVVLEYRLAESIELDGYSWSRYRRE